MDVGSVRPIERATLFQLFHESLRQAVPRTQLHGAQHRLGLRCPQIVVLQVAVSVLVDQEPAFGPGGFGNQNPREGETRGMVLHELHVLQRHSRAVGQGHAVAILDVGIGGEGEHLPATAGTDDDGLGGDGLDLSRHQLNGHHPLHPAVVHQKPGDEPFVVASDGSVFQRGLKEGVEHVKAGLVGGEPGAFLFHSAEGANGHPPVGFPAPGATPMLQLQHLPWGLPDEDLHGILVTHPVPARDGVVGVFVQTVALLDHGRTTAFRRHRVAPHGINLGDHCHAQIGGHLGNGNGGSQACSSATHQQHVMGRHFCQKSHLGP